MRFTGYGSKEDEGVVLGACAEECCRCRDDVIGYGEDGWGDCFRIGSEEILVVFEKGEGRRASCVRVLEDQGCRHGIDDID